MAKVLDSSALLAFLLNEPGSEKVAPHVPGGMMSAVNAAEVLLVLVRGGVPLEAAELALRKTQVAILDFTLESAAVATRIMIGDSEFKSRGISFGDRACMATALQRGLAVITADRAWQGLKIDGLQIDFIR
jgi:PIN domain nuclease of toxin-antitoxin system